MKPGNRDLCDSTNSEDLSGRNNLMRIVEKHSHLNGDAYLYVHHPQILEEIEQVVESVDADECWNGFGNSTHAVGTRTFSAEKVARQFDNKLKDSGWIKRTGDFWRTQDSELTKIVSRMHVDMQRRSIKFRGRKPMSARLEIKYVKLGVALQVQLGEPSMVANDLLVTYMNFYASQMIDVGIEIVPVQEFERQMSTNVPCYERDLMNIVGQVPGEPPMPLVLIGIAP